MHGGIVQFTDTWISFEETQHGY